MNQSAWNRFGQVVNLLDAVPASRSEALRFLNQPEAAGRKTLGCLFERAGRREAVPVQFVTVLASERTVVLDARVRERASDSTPPVDATADLLLEMERNAIRNYFRLLRAQDAVEGGKRRITREVGALFAEELDKERTRIARELHATAGQTLAGIKLNLELIRAALPEAPVTAQLSFNRIHLLADEALSQLRGIVQRLHSPDWQRMPLQDAIEWLWNTTGIPDKFTASFKVGPIGVEPPHAVRIAIYRAAQEALSNVLRHSGATQVELLLEKRDGAIYLSVMDNGSGFDPNEILAPGPQSRSRGIGLRATQDQVRSLHGEFQIQSGSEGTTMSISLPLEENL